MLSRRRFLKRAAVGGGLLVASGGLVGLAGCGAGGEEEAGARAPGDDKAVGGGPFAARVEAGLRYFAGRAEEQLPLVEGLLAAVRGGDLGEAREAYVAARPPYEEIEVLAASFAETDEAIDARPYAFDEGESSEDFRGFHRIEGLIFRDGDLEAAVPYAEGLVESVRRLRGDLGRREGFDAASHFGGMISLTNEVASKKISSEEETYSDQSLLIFRHNWRGVYSQFEPFFGEVERRDARAATAVRDAHEAALALVDPYFPNGGPAAEPYSSVGMNVRGQIVKASYRLRDSITQAGEVLGLV